jgi:hypothetical protein
MIHSTDNTLMPPLSASAWFSDCLRYRYALERTWDTRLWKVCWLMLNPSTADAFVLDPTIRRCIGFARAWGYGGISVVNLFAFRATDPADMRSEPNPVAEGGNESNDSYILSETWGRKLIAAWGCGGTHLGRDRQVMELLGGRKVECLGVTKDGCPRHPLYVKGDAVPVPYRMSGVESWWDAEKLAGIAGGKGE